MKRTSIILCLLLLIAASGIQCGKDGGSGGVFIPDLSLNWVNKANATNTFFFLTPQTNVSSTTFTGNENPIGGGAQYHFSGSVNNKDIQFTYDNASGAKSNKSYSGTLNDASNVMTLTSTTLGSLVLEKK